MWCSIRIILFILRVPPSCFQKSDEDALENRRSSRGPQLAKPRPRALRQNVAGLSDNNNESTIEYYTQEYYSSSLEEEIFPGTSNRSTTTTAKPTTSRTSSTFSNIDTMEDELTDDAWALMPNWRELKGIYLLHLPVVSANDEIHDCSYAQDIKWFNIMCYQLGSTFFNAKTNLRDYYRIRYAYYNNKEFEIGYIVHEIVYKYTVLLELFHNVQYRYYNQSRFLNLAPNSYMVYMYTVIVEQAQQIMHLCNVLHEVDKKYSALDDFQGDADVQAKYAEFGYYVAEENKNMKWMEEQKEKQRLKALKKKLRKEKKALKKTGIFSSTRRTRRPQTQGRLPHHYGWSIEYW